MQTGMNISIVFLVWWPITDREIEKYGINYLKDQGFKVEVFDLTQLLNKTAILKSPVESEIKANDIYKINTYQELSNKIKEAVPRSIFIDNITGLAEFNLITEKLYRTLKKYNSTYYVIAGGALPIPCFPKSINHLARMLFRRVKKIFNLKKLFDFIIRKIIFLIRKWTSIYPLPAKIFGGNSEVLSRYVRRYNINRRCIIPIHSLDYDTYLNRTTDFEIKANDNICVFLDEAATHHPDFFILNIEPLSERNYFLSMNRLFDKIEKETGLEVVIAAHPRSKYEHTPLIFGSRRIAKGKTIELVAKSSMVIMHSSTSVNFAVLFNKPILVVKTSEMLNKSQSEFVDTIADALGIEAVNIDDNISFNSLNLNYNEWPKDKYDDYKYKYIKSRDVEDLTIWEIVAKEIKIENLELNRLKHEEISLTNRSRNNK